MVHMCMCVSVCVCLSRQCILTLFAAFQFIYDKKKKKRDRAVGEYANVVVQGDTPLNNGDSSTIPLTTSQGEWGRKREDV